VCLPHLAGFAAAARVFAPDDTLATDTLQCDTYPLPCVGCKLAQAFVASVADSGAATSSSPEVRCAGCSHTNHVWRGVRMTLGQFDKVW
jgi:hypothetical protein